MSLRKRPVEALKNLKNILRGLFAFRASKRFLGVGVGKFGRAKSSGGARRRDLTAPTIGQAASWYRNTAFVAVHLFDLQLIMICLN
jgi:hypothetical protein